VLTSYRANGFLVYEIIWRASVHHNRALPSSSALVCIIHMHSCAIASRLPSERNGHMDAERIE